MSELTVQCAIEQLESAGLMLTGQPGEWPIVLTAGCQFLTVEGGVAVGRAALPAARDR